MADKKFLLAGSILSADLLKLGDDVEDALKAGSDIIHFDVMDYHFVPNLTFGPMFLKQLRKRFPDAVFDVHLMTDPANDQVVDSYIDAGASWISFHPEACPHAERLLAHIQERGCKAGLALNPSTPPQMLSYLWERLDFVLVMTVNPGFGGQKLIPACVTKVSDIRRMAVRETPRRILIEVDGGVSAQNIREIADAGARVFVVGSALFGAKDRAAAVKALRAGLEG
ncbi:MAG: ribulose-phosphate 3-epimerase [Succinivibrio sp.]|jgi:ribulose-phosphate 3-epimerase|nr:ribulose-phosphate 3-epimerase [Succinivibrio sp.]